MESLTALSGNDSGFALLVNPVIRLLQLKITEGEKTKDTCIPHTADTACIIEYAGF